MAENIRFDFEKTDIGNRLTISGPTEVFKAAEVTVAKSTFRLFGKHLFKYREEMGRSYFGFNAKAVGKLSEKHRRQALERTNRFIGQVAILGKEMKISDPNLDIINYPNADDADLEILVARPKHKPSDAQAIQTLLLHHTVDMASDLRLYGPKEPVESYLNRIRPEIFYNSKALTVRLTGLGEDLRLRADPRELSEGSQHLRLLGSVGRNGAVPLIYLANAVALARAD